MSGGSSVDEGGKIGKVLYEEIRDFPALIFKSKI